MYLQLVLLRIPHPRTWAVADDLAFRKHTLKGVGLTTKREHIELRRLGASRTTSECRLLCCLVLDVLFEVFC